MPNITKELLVELYVNDLDASLESTGRVLGVSRETVKRRLKKFGLPVKPKWRHGNIKPQNAPLLDKEWLAEQLQTKTAKRTGEEIGTSCQDVIYWAEKHGIWPMSRDKSASLKSAIGKKYPEGRFGEAASNWRGGTRHANKQGYVYVYCPDHPHATKAGYVMEHRLVMEGVLGRYLSPNEDVHHINGDPADNKPENLRPCSRKEHFLQHAENRAAKRRAELENIARLKEELARLRSILDEHGIAY